MTIRIVHTADNHIGMPFRQHGDEARNQLLEERFAGATGVKVAVGGADGQPLRFEPRND